MQCLEAVSRLDLPQGMIAAGFVRNLVWDQQQAHAQATALDDVDVVFFDAGDISLQREHMLEQTLRTWLPAVNWQVRNQARMHMAYGIAAYVSAADAVQRFPETATCLAVMLDAQGDLCFPVQAGLADAWAMRLSPNPLCRTSGFQQRVREKQWLQHWPRLQLDIPEKELP